MLIVAFDPGLSGGIAFHDTVTGSMRVHPMPVFALSRNGKAKNEIDAVGLARLVDVSQPQHAFVELVNAAPGQGTSSMFAFGKGFGIILGILAANFIPVTLVPPVTWKRDMRVPADKDAARARATALMPAMAGSWARVKDDGLAEAALIALHGAKRLAAGAI